MPTGSRIVLQANIGQFDSIQTAISASLVTLNSADTNTGSLRNTVFASRANASLGIGDPVFTSFKANSQFFIRRLRIASELQQYGAKTLNRGFFGISTKSSVPAKTANSSFIQLWLMNGSNNTQILKFYETNNIPVLNEWQDVNILVPASGAGTQNVTNFFAATFNIDADFTDISTRLVSAGQPIQLRLEMEIDYPDTALNQTPLVPPTNPAARVIWGVNQHTATQNWGVTTTVRATLKNVYGQTMKDLRLAFPLQGTGSFAQIIGAYIGYGSASGSNNMDFASWQPLLFSGSPSFSPSGSWPNPALGFIITDDLILSTPQAVGNIYCVSVVYGIGNYAGQTNGNNSTPLDNALVNIFSAAGSFGTASGQTWNTASYLPFSNVIAGF
jgi:hypothetical protein